MPPNVAAVVGVTSRTPPPAPHSSDKGGAGVLPENLSDTKSPLCALTEYA